MKRPNFFIIGAPKCGTTSLAHWLSDHPNVFMPSRKEPHYFNLDEDWGRLRDLEEYEELFVQAGPQHLAVGEASVWYLYSRDAVPNIEAYTTRCARYVVCIRNPVEMAPSLHEQSIVSAQEPIADFWTAWQESSKRSAGQFVSSYCREPRHLAYRDACSTGTQIQRLLDIVPRSRVCLVLLDDVKSNPRANYLRVLDFLGVPDDGRKHFPTLNAAKERRSMFLKQLSIRLGRIKQRLPIHFNAGILNWLNRMNMRSRPRQALPPWQRQELEKAFAGEIGKLEDLLDRDLSDWTRHR